MDRLDPYLFKGPRTYFTDFDHRIVVRSKDTELLRIQAERKLKLLLLIKANIVCAASHLATEFAYNIFRENSRLISEGHIIPALRKDKDSFTDLLERKKIDKKDEIIDFYNHNVKYTADWELDDNSGWFRENFIKEISNPVSVIRKQLARAASNELNPTLIKNFKRELGESSIISRSQIEGLTTNMSTKQKELLLNFRELLYHISGARVVHCESSIPQENYIDYDIADFKQNRTKLSDHQILFKMFIELALETIQQRMIPYELLDWLSFDDILAIRKPILDSEFQNKYEVIVKKIVSEIKEDNSQFFFDINELEEIRSLLEKTFNQVFDEELPEFIKGKVKQKAKSLVSVSSSLALGFLGFFPGLGSIASGVSILKDSPSLIFNLRQTFSSQKAIDNIKLYKQNREELLRKQVEKSDLSDKSTMLDMVNILNNLLGEKLKI
ncbi:MAG TPA: hypothetical protein VKM37_09075 [Balneolaceae bacterium]|nr:hypothetical protein [Balneolaceae bacterium]